MSNPSWSFVVRWEIELEDSNNTHLKQPFDIINEIYSYHKNIKTSLDRLQAKQCEHGMWSYLADIHGHSWISSGSAITIHQERHAHWISCLKYVSINSCWNISVILNMTFFVCILYV